MDTIKGYTTDYATPDILESTAKAAGYMAAANSRHRTRLYNDWLVTLKFDDSCLARLAALNITPTTAARHLARVGYNDPNGKEYPRLCQLYAGNVRPVRVGILGSLIRPQQNRVRGDMACKCGPRYVKACKSSFDEL